MADALVTCAGVWSLESNDMAEPAITFLAEALRGSIFAHWQDIDLLTPWANLRANSWPATKPPLLLDAMPTWAALPEHCKAISRMLANRQHGGTQVRPHALDGTWNDPPAAARSPSRLATIADLAKTMFDAMEFGFLFDPDRQLLSIGYRVRDGRSRWLSTTPCSEARLASFIAIAKGDIPQSTGSGWDEP